MGPKITRSTALVSLATLCAMLFAMAASILPSGAAFAADGHADAVSDDVPEVVVESKLYKLREAIIEAEDRFHARYNELNDDHQYDIRCSWEAPTGTLLKRRHCEARFAIEAAQQDVGNMLSTTGTGGVFVPWAQITNANRMAELKNHMMQVIRSHPELIKLLLERDRVAKRYDEIYAKQFGKH